MIKLIARIVLGFLWIRFALKLIGVAGTGLVATLYQWTGYLTSPFGGVFPNIDLAGRFTVETTTLFAIVVYALLEFILVRRAFGRSHGDY